MSGAPSLPAAQALSLAELIVGTPHGIASRVLARSSGGNLTLFAFDAGQELSEHSTPYDALVLVLEGQLTLVIGGEAVTAGPGSITRMPANVAHSVVAVDVSRMLLLMLK